MEGFKLVKEYRVEFTLFKVVPFPWINPLTPHSIFQDNPPLDPAVHVKSAEFIVMLSAIRFWGIPQLAQPIIPFVLGGPLCSNGV